MNAELAQKVMELAETGLEGLEHVHRQNMAGNVERTIPVFMDVLESFTEIVSVLSNRGLLENHDDALVSSTKDLQDGFDWMVKAYEKRENTRPLEIMQLTLLPRYKKWQEILNERLRVYMS